MAETRTQTAPLLPLQRGVVLPHMVVTVGLETDEAKASVAAAHAADGIAVLVPKIDGRFARIGTVAKIEDSGVLPSGAHAAVVRGLYRVTLGTGVPSGDNATWVEISAAPDSADASEHVRTLAEEYRSTIEAIVELRGAPEVADYLRTITDPGQMADTAGYSPDLSYEQKVEVLETLDVEARLEKVLEWSKEILAEVEVKNRIRSEVNDSMNKAQREMILRQQLAAIRKELGEDGGVEDAIAEYRRVFAEKDLPEDVRAQVEREISRLERMGEQSVEASWIRSYLDWMSELPWGVRSEDTLDIGAAREILDADHTGLDEIKDRIVEHLAVRKLRRARGLEDAGRGAGAIVTLVGPPGVGKTSLGESIARALGRKFARVALGGIRDEAEIRGHRRTYVGALPGRIVRALKDAGTMNPVLLLDEVDKVGADWRGDPSSALLEVLDPAQNHTFRDHYLDVDLDLSGVLFVATANVIETIPGPLLDRMEVLRLDGYTEDEKVVIARDHLLPRRLEDAGLGDDEVEIHEPALRRIISGYTREAGVRGLERTLGRVARKVATRIASEEATPPVVVSEDDVRSYLGRTKFEPEAAERTSVAGVATGLAVTGMGGDVLFIEATDMNGEPGLTLTGQLGDVMKESAQIARSYVRGHASELGIDVDVDTRHIHLHVPAGAVPKDGPSAGITMTTALASLFSRRAVRHTVGMTGEITLQGKVLPIGGVKQKVLAAHRAGLTEVILPRRNEHDLEDVPESVIDVMTFHFADDIADVLAIALEDAEVDSAA